jgi:CRP/FNR family cyclic AMP-dependent transcriptional regulator
VATKPVDVDKKVSFLARSPVFSGLDEKQLKTLVRFCVERSFAKGEKIVREGESGIGLYLILEGQVQIERGGKPLARLGSGQFFGEMALLDEQPRSADVIALEQTNCLLMTRWDFRAVVKTNPEIAINIMRELARRLREVEKLIE